MQVAQMMARFSTLSPVLLIASMIEAGGHGIVCRSNGTWVSQTEFRAQDDCRRLWTQIGVSEHDPESGTLTRGRGGSTQRWCFLGDSTMSRLYNAAQSQLQSPPGYDYSSALLAQHNETRGKCASWCGRMKVPMKEKCNYESKECSGCKGCDTGHWKLPVGPPKCQITRSKDRCSYHKYLKVHRPKHWVKPNLSIEGPYHYGLKHPGCIDSAEHPVECSGILASPTPELGQLTGRIEPGASARNVTLEYLPVNTARSVTVQTPGAATLQKVIGKYLATRQKDVCIFANIIHDEALQKAAIERGLCGLQTSQVRLGLGFSFVGLFERASRESD